MLIFNLIVLSFGLFMMVKVFIQIIKLNSQHRKYKKTIKQHELITNKISHFLNEGNNVSLYQEKLYTYLNSISSVKFSTIEEAVKSYEESSKVLYEEFKYLIPDLIQEERDKKINELIK